MPDHTTPSPVSQSSLGPLTMPNTDTSHANLVAMLQHPSFVSIMQRVMPQLDPEADIQSYLEPMQSDPHVHQMLYQMMSSNNLLQYLPPAQVWDELKDPSSTRGQHLQSIMNNIQIRTESSTIQAAQPVLDTGTESESHDDSLPNVSVDVQRVSAVSSDPSRPNAVDATAVMSIVAPMGDTTGLLTVHRFVATTSMVIPETSDATTSTRQEHHVPDSGSESKQNKDTP